MNLLFINIFSSRFSAFVKAGAEGFMIGAVKDVTIDPNSLIHVVVSNFWYIFIFLSFFPLRGQCGNLI